MCHELQNKDMLQSFFFLECRSSKFWFYGLFTIRLVQVRLYDQLARTDEEEEEDEELLTFRSGRMNQN